MKRQQKHSIKINKNSNAYLGWVPDLPDIRDLTYSAPIHLMRGDGVPESVDLRDKCPPVYDQGALGSCTANGIGFAHHFDQLKQGLTEFMPSRLFIYYNERVMEGSVSSDAGASIRDGIKSINKQGVADEKNWGYDISKFTVKPDDSIYKEALGNVTLSYQRVPRDLDQMRSVLIQGYPFVVGFTVYSYFETQEMSMKGTLNLPKQGEVVLGGHCVAVVGYDDVRGCFIVRNSWGPGWGMGGYFYMSYNYLLNENLSDDFWVVRSVK